jgi:NAD(P)-dependent dehydrogenase (short-subunit alcohol dehydrogenase family)
MSQLRNKVAVVTGGTSGIGLAITKRFVAEGAYVFITALTEKDRQEASKLFADNVEAIVCDVSKVDDLAHFFDAVNTAKGRIDVLVANAGVAKQAKLDEITEDHFDWIFGINARGVLFTAQKALPLMREGGSIILLGSLSGANGEENLSVYAATKAVVSSYAQSWSRELAHRGIRVNTLSPGPTDTSIMNNLPEEGRRALTERTPLKRMGRRRSRRRRCSSHPTKAAT